MNAAYARPVQPEGPLEPEVVLAERVMHVESLLALGRLVVSASRGPIVRSWFVLLMQDAAGALVVRVDA